MISQTNCTTLPRRDNRRNGKSDQIRWPDNLTDAEFDALIDRLPDLHPDPFVQRLAELALDAARPVVTTGDESEAV